MIDADKSHTSFKMDMKKADPLLAENQLHGNLCRIQPLSDARADTLIIEVLLKYREI